MTAHEFARQLLDGPDLPLAFTHAAGEPWVTAPPQASEVLIRLEPGSMTKCLLIEPEGSDIDDLGDVGVSTSE